MCVKHLAQCLAQTKCPINVSHEEMLKDDSDSRDPTQWVAPLPASRRVLTVPVSWWIMNGLVYLLVCTAC